MKKLLAIVVLGLLLSSNAYALINDRGEDIAFCASPTSSPVILRIELSRGSFEAYERRQGYLDKRCYFRELTIKEYLIEAYKYWSPKMSKKKFIEWQVDQFKLFNLNTDIIFETLGGKPKTVAKKPETTVGEIDCHATLKKTELKIKGFDRTDSYQMRFIFREGTLGSSNKIQLWGTVVSFDWATHLFTYTKPDPNTDFCKVSIYVEAMGSGHLNINFKNSKLEISFPGLGLQTVDIISPSSNQFVYKTPSKKEPPKVVKKPKKKEPPKKQITKAPEIDESLLTIGSGSGFYINNKGYALTNNHVVDICKQMVAVVDGKEILLRVLNTDKINDVAVLKTDYKSRSYIKINEDGAKLGENVIAVGYPLAGQLSDSVKITRGIVSSLSGLDNNIGQIQIDAALQPGNSGGPVLNEKGELVGIASAGLNKLLMAKEAKYIPENVNFAVASPIVVNILKSKKIKYTTPSMFSGTYSNTELAELGDSSTIQLLCRNTRTAYNRLKRSNKYSTILLDLD